MHSVCSTRDAGKLVLKICPVAGVQPALFWSLVASGTASRKPIGCKLLKSSFMPILESEINTTVSLSQGHQEFFPSQLFHIL